MLYVPTLQLRDAGQGVPGRDVLLGADNPPYGAVFTYQLKDGLKTLKQKRVDAEKAAEKAGQPIRYPTADELRAEADEEAPAILLTVSGADGTPIRVITGPIEKGHATRRLGSSRAGASAAAEPPARRESRSCSAIRWSARIVVPGKYSVTLSQRVGGVVTAAGGPGLTFNVVLDPQAAHQRRRPDGALAVPGEAAGAEARCRRRAGAGQQHEHPAGRDHQGARRHAGGAARAARSGARRCSGGSPRSSWSCRAIGGSAREAGRARRHLGARRTRSAAS